MALTLMAAITAGQTTFDVAGSDDLQPGDFKTLDSETVVIRTATQRTLGYGESAYRRVSVYRGSGGTRAAAHDASTTLATYSGGGGSGVTVDNGTDPPAEVTTIVAAGADVSTPSEATLAPFTGGLLTEATVIQVPTAAEEAFRVSESETPHIYIVVQAGSVALQATPTGSGLTLDSAGAALNDEAGDPVFQGAAGVVYLGPVQVVSVIASGHLVVAAGAAPADGDLFAGDCAFWFDKTNGASKLMIKGKSANGTVVNGEVALS